MSVQIQKNDAIWTIIIHRPEARNAVDGPTAAALADAFRDFDRDDTAAVAVLYGDGGTFCAGADLKAVAAEPARANRLSPDGDGPMGPSRLLLSKPVIAAIEGYAVAGGLELACWCDLRVASEEAVFGVFCRRFGVPLIDGGTVRLSRLIGHSRALDMILTGRPVAASEALSFGLANRIVPAGSARQAAEALAAELVQFPQTCLQQDRLSSYEQWSMGLQEALDNEFQRGMSVVESGETVDGASAFSSGKGRGGPILMLGKWLRTLAGRPAGASAGREEAPTAIATDQEASVSTDETAESGTPGLPFMIRPLEQPDLPALATVFRRSITELASRDYSKEQQQTWAASADDPVFMAELAEGVTIVADNDGVPVAFAQLHPMDYLRMLYVDPEWSGLGIPMLLYQYLEDEARIAGCTSLSTHASRTALEFFRGMGFKDDGEEEIQRTGIAFTRHVMTKLLVNS